MNSPQLHMEKNSSRSTVPPNSRAHSLASTMVSALYTIADSFRSCNRDFTEGRGGNITVETVEEGKGIKVGPV